MPATTSDRLLTRKEAAAVLGLKPQTLAVWAAHRPHLPFTKVGGYTRYRRADLEEFLRTNTIEPRNRAASAQGGGG